MLRALSNTKNAIRMEIVVYRTRARSNIVLSVLELVNEKNFCKTNAAPVQSALCAAKYMREIVASRCNR